MEAPQPLRKKEDIVRVLRQGRRLHAPLFRLHMRAQKSSAVRVAIVVGVAVSKKAVVRNRIRRRTREAFLRATAGHKGAFDAVILPNAQTEHAPFSELVSAFKKVLSS